ncbi:DUF5818 domain-containing protein [Sphingomonas sp. 1P06PA]|uniref:DUF5818 domain-containing protein n=1 Tax=Sphingomonas sp. 1P06PA TaxID=554121 RepID=UPI0039A64DB1
MQDLQTRPSARCHERGRLVMKGECYALRRDDGVEFWLEMDRIPQHLIDRPVIVEGTRFATTLISVALIGPER